MGYVFNPFTFLGFSPSGSSGGGSGANTSLSNLNNPTAINQALTFAGTGTIKTPAGASIILNTANNNPGTAGSIDLEPGLDSSSTGRGPIRLFANDIQIQTDNFTTIRTQDQVNTGLNIQTGSPGGIFQSGSLALSTGAAGSGTTGNISLTTGTTSGTRGNIIFQDGSQSLGAGAVWTLQDTAGTGHWATPSGGGANVHLSNLSSTAINADISPGVADTINLGAGANNAFNQLNINYVRASTFNGGTGQLLDAGGSLAVEWIGRGLYDTTGGSGLSVDWRQRQLIASNGTSVAQSWASQSGPTGSRPSTANLAIGYYFFDTTLNKPIWWNGTNWITFNTTMINV